MQKKLVLSLGVLSLLFACTPVQEPGGETGTGGSPSGTGGSGSGGSSGTGGSPAGTGGGGSGTGGSPAGTGGDMTGTGGSPAGTGGSAPGTGGGGGGTTDAAPSGDSGTPPGGMGPAGALHNLVIKVPCPNQTGMGASCSIATDVRAYDKPIMIGGTAGTTYKVKLKICAVYEGRPYTGCMTSPDSPRICINGTPGTQGFAGTYPTLGIKTDAMTTYYLNAGNDYADKILKFDYTGTFEMKGGSTINFISNGGSNGGVYTAFQGGARHTCPDVPGVMQPYLGQFIHVQVVSVDPMN